MMKFHSRQTEKLARCLDSIPAGVNHCVLAFSGGLDSCVLLHLLANRSPLVKIKLWHVHHGLQAEADAMAEFCQHIAHSYGLDMKLSHLNLQATTSNIESIARKARYQLFSKGLADNDYLLTAHHADDQAETFFLNVLRGSGSAGLRGIAARKPLSNATLIRPMLGIKREVLLDYAKQHGLKWFEDPSNSSHRFNRNYLRRMVLPLIEKRWPNYQQSIATVCEIQGETQAMLDDLGKIDCQQVAENNGDLQGEGSQASLNIQSLGSLSLARQKNVIRYWLRINGRVSLPRARLDTFMKQLAARQGANPVIENIDYDLRIYKGRVYIVDQEDVPSLQAVYDFSTQSRLEIPELGLLFERQSVLDYLSVEDSGQNIQVGFRLTGASNSGSNSKHAHRLKRLFQKHKIPPWQRPSTPLLFLNGELIDLWLKT